MNGFIIGLIISLLKKANRMVKDFNINDAEKAFKELKKYYNADESAVVEKIMRLETNHFKSENFKKTGSGGMEIATGKTSFPYGWSTPLELWKNDDFKPVGTLSMKENGTGKVKTFIVFPSVRAAVFTIAEIMKKRNWNAGSWFSNNPTEQAKYNQSINGIKARF